MGLDIYLDWPGAAKNPEYDSLNADIDAQADPKHICKRNYLRSSYNGGGFNSVANTLIGMDFYTIFEPMGVDINRYEYHPTDEQLQACRVNAVEALKEMEAAPALGATFLHATTLRPQDGTIVSEAQAMEAYLQEADKPDPFGDGGWSNAFGTFWTGEPLEVHAAIAGRGLLGDDGVYLVFKQDLSHYINTAKIVIEFIDEALSHPEREIHWSG